MSRIRLKGLSKKRNHHSNISHSGWQRIFNLAIAPVSVDIQTSKKEWGRKQILEHMTIINVKSNKLFLLVLVFLGLRCRFRYLKFELETVDCRTCCIPNALIEYSSSRARAEGISAWSKLDIECLLCTSRFWMNIRKCAYTLRAIHWRQQDE